MSKDLKDYYIMLFITIFVVIPLACLGLLKLSESQKTVSTSSPSPTPYCNGDFEYACLPSTWDGDKEIKNCKYYQICYTGDMPGSK